MFNLLLPIVEDFKVIATKDLITKDYILHTEYMGWR